MLPLFLKEETTYNLVGLPIITHTSLCHSIYCRTFEDDFLELTEQNDRNEQAN